MTSISHHLGGTVSPWHISTNFSAIWVLPAPPSPYKTKMRWFLEPLKKHSRIWARISYLPVNVCTAGGQCFNFGGRLARLRTFPEGSGEWSNLLWEWLGCRPTKRTVCDMYAYMLRIWHKPSRLVFVFSLHSENSLMLFLEKLTLWTDCGWGATPDGDDGDDGDGRLGLSICNADRVLSRIFPLKLGIVGGRSSSAMSRVVWMLIEAMPAPAPRAIPAPVTPASTASRVSNFPARCEVRMQLICDGRRWRC